MIRMAKRIQSLYSDLAGHSDDCEPTLYMRSRRSLVPSCEEQHFHRAATYLPLTLRPLFHEWPDVALRAISMPIQSPRPQTARMTIVIATFFRTLVEGSCS
jgi:hypothetical protein